MATDGGEAERRILQRRALDLARVEIEQEAADDLELVRVRCGRADYALETRWVREIQPLRRLTPLPGAHRAWAGLMNLRGAIYAVLGLARYLEIEEEQPPVPQVVILDAGRDAIGLLVDDTIGADRVGVDDLRPPPDTGSSRRSVVRAMTPAMIAVLDIEVILDDPDLSADMREESL